MFYSATINLPIHETEYNGNSIAIVQVFLGATGSAALFEELFDEVVRKCIEHGLIDGKLLLTDSTHVRQRRFGARCRGSGAIRISSKA